MLLPFHARRRGARDRAGVPLPGAALLLLFALPITAADPAVQIHELLAGTNGDSRVQFITLRFAAGEAWGPGVGQTAGRALLEFHDAAGAATGTFVFPSGPPAGAPDAQGLRSVLIATQGFAELAGVPVPDYLLPAGLLVPDGGKVCFRPNPESPGLTVNLCLSYGPFAGSTESDTSTPPEPAGSPAAALPITGVRSLKRFRNFTAEFLGKKQRNADFQLGAPEGRNSAGDLFVLAEAPAVDQGRTLFFKESFRGNGRTCATCHAETDAFGLSPQGIAALPPDDPLFVFETVPELHELENGPLLRGPTGLILENIDGFDEPHVFRGSPALISIALTAPFGLSGEIATLSEFSTGAVKQHFPRTLVRNADPATAPMDFRLPTAEELAHMDAFMGSLTLELNLDLMMASAVFRGADAATVRRGRQVFFGDQAKCFKCHSGPALADVDPSLVADGTVAGPGNHRFNTGVAARGALNGFPGTHEVAREFSTRPLVGVALRRAFFHDHSAINLKDAVDFYCSGCDENFFVTSPGAKQIGGLTFDQNDDRLAVTAFLEALVPPAPECAGGPDCDQNGIADACEIAAFSERDCDLNGMPDACEADTIDCDENGIADECDLSMSPERDCNGNAVPDACDIAGGSSQDCNANRLPDECERGGLVDASNPAGLHPSLASVITGRPQIAPVFAMSGGGDVNGDGVDDLLIGAKPEQPQGDFDLPESYVLFGRAGFGSDGAVDLAALDGTAGFRLTGFTQRFSSTGFVLAAAGDFNRDGLADFVAGDRDSGPGARRAAGMAYVIFGRAGLGAGGTLAVDTLDGTDGFALEGTKAIDQLGASVAGGGDLNGDGAPDVAIGAPFADPGKNGAGEAYVIFGSSAPLATPLTPASLDGRTGFVIQGSRELDLAGGAVAFAGDVNGDGIDDLLVGAEGADPGGRESAGETYVIFGARTVGAAGVFPLESLNGANGFTIRGARELDSNLHIAVASAGDVNADGFADILTSAQAADPGGHPEAGEAYLVFGGAAVGASGAVELIALAGDAGFAMRGPAAGIRLGTTFAPLGDLTGDGFDDFAVGAGGGREVYALYGGPAIGGSGTVEVETLSGGEGAAIQLRAPSEDLPDAFIANVVGPAGDLNADGVADLALGLKLPSSDPVIDSGRMLVLFGPFYPADCDANGIPDSCQVADGSAPDANANGVPDACEAPPPSRFRRGDADGDGVFNITDPIVTLNCLFIFQGVKCLACLDASDANDDGAINITDPIFSLGCQFLGSRCPPAPFEHCGPDPTADSVPCTATGCP